MANAAFIIAQTRSGSTLLQRMLGSHPSCLTSAGEPYLMLALLQGFKGPALDTTGRWAKDAARMFLSEFASEPALHLALREAADTIYGDVLEKASFLCHAFDRPRKTLFIDKTPRYFLILDDLLRMYQPESFVFLVRNPLDQLASTLNFDKVKHWGRLDRVEDKFFPGMYIDKSVDIFEGPQAIAKAIKRLGDRACVVQYEQLVTDPVDELGRVCDHLHLPFDVAMLEYEKGEGRYSDDNSVGKHTRPVADYIGNWRERMDPLQAGSYLEELGAEVLEVFGYPELITEFAVEFLP